MRRAVCGGKVREGEIIAVQFIVGASAQVIGICARAARNARIVDEMREFSNRTAFLAALDHRRCLVKDAPERVALLELDTDRRFLRPLRAFVAGEEVVVLLFQRIALLLETCDLRLI